jgi:hypothetical protein
VGFEAHRPYHLYNDLILVRIAEVVGSNPTRFISSILVNYGIKLSLF